MQAVLSKTTFQNLFKMNPHKKTLFLPTSCFFYSTSWGKKKKKTSYLDQTLLLHIALGCKPSNASNKGTIF